MDQNINIYSEPLLPLSQGWPYSSVSSTQVTQASQLTRTGGPPNVGRGSDQEDLLEDSVQEEDDNTKNANGFDLTKVVVRASELRQQYCTTGCSILDKQLKGGIPTFGITELYGDAGTGKTQFCLQLSILAQLREHAGGLESNVAYISTEKIRDDRLATLVGHFKSVYPNELPDNPMSNIFVDVVQEADGLMECVARKLENLARQKDRIRFVILDSIASIFRSDFDDLALRTSELRRLGQLLHEFSLEHDASILVCNQVTSSLTSEGNIASLGKVWSNMVTTRIRLSKSTSINEAVHRSLMVTFSPHISSVPINFQITAADGVKGLGEGQ